MIEMLIMLILNCVSQKQIYVAPHRRIEEKADQQRRMERSFEDLYMNATGYFIFCSRVQMITRILLGIHVHVYLV